MGWFSEVRYGLILVPLFIHYCAIDAACFHPGKNVKVLKDYTSTISNLNLGNHAGKDSCAYLRSLNCPELGISNLWGFLHIECPR